MERWGCLVVVSVGFFRSSMTHFYRVLRTILDMFWDISEP
jgi:hypothetical protein